MDEQPWPYRWTLGVYDTWAELSNKRRADGIIALSGFTRARALGIGIAPDRVVVIHGGADVRRIGCFERGSRRRGFGIPANSLCFGFVGLTENELRDILPFVLAVNQLKRTIDITWFCTGRKLTDVEKEIYQIGIECLEYGWVPYKDYSALLSCADVFVLMSRDNAVNVARWPNKIGDYLAAGRPVMLNPFGDLAEYVRRFPEAFIPVSWKTDSIKAAILGISNNRDILVEKGNQARRLAEKHLSWSYRAQEMETFYRAILTKP